MSKIWIKNGRVWDGETFRMADVLTNGSVIEKIGPHLEAEAEYVYDAEGKIVSAGLVDLHVHLRGISSDRYGIQAEMSSFPFGVTAVNDAGAAHGDASMLRHFAVKNTVFASVDIKKNHIDRAKAEERLARFGERAVGLKVYFDATVSECWDLTPVHEVCAMAKERGLRVMVHCAYSPVSMGEIVGALSAGDILTHAYHCGEHSCLMEDFACFDLAKERGVIIDTGFAGDVHTDFEVFSKAFESGYFPDTISTDITCCSAYKRGGKYGMTLCMSLAKNAGMEEDALFKAVTSTPAKVLGKEWGVLKEGGVADLAVFEWAEEPCELTDAQGNCVKNTMGYRCVLTISDGFVLYRR